MRLAGQQPVGAQIHFRPLHEGLDMIFRAVKIDHAHGILFFIKQIKQGIIAILMALLRHFRQRQADQRLIGLRLDAGDVDLVETGKGDEVVPARNPMLDIVDMRFRAAGSLSLIIN